jgi:hypothetical protein
LEDIGDDKLDRKISICFPKKKTANKIIGFSKLKLPDPDHPYIEDEQEKHKDIICRYLSEFLYFKTFINSLLCPL